MTTHAKPVVSLPDAANVPATLVGYGKEGKATVTLLEPLGGLHVGAEVAAFLAPSRLRRGPPHDFEYLHRKGLRLGGVVILRKAVVEHGAVVAREIETLKRKGDVMDVRVIPGTLCCILPSADPTTAMVEEAVLAFPREAVKVRTISSVLGDIEASLEEPCLYGPTGLVFRGPDAEGRIALHVVAPDGVRPPHDIVEDLLHSVPREFLRHARRGSRPQWEAVPITEVAVDPEHQPRLSGQAANYPYVGSDGTRRFTLGTATLSLIGESWVLSDATPLGVAPEAVGLD